MSQEGRRKAALRERRKAQAIKAAVIVQAAVTAALLAYVVMR